MKSSPNERLSEHLLNIDEEILANAYKIDTAEKLRQYIKTKNVNRKKSLYLNPVFRKTATVAACLFLIIGGDIFHSVTIIPQQLLISK